MITRQEYMAIKQQLDFTRHGWVSCLVILATGALFLTGIKLLTLHNVFAFLSAQVIFALCFLQSYALFHECIHDTAAPKRWINHVIGHYTSLFCLFPYFTFRFIHVEHHIWAGNLDKDPTLKAVRGARETTSENRLYKVVWKLWIPLVYASQFLVFWLYPLTLRSQGKLTKERYWRSCFSVGFMVVSYAALYWLWPAIFNLGNFFIAFVLYWFCMELINYPHHLVLPMFRDEGQDRKLHPWEQYTVARSCDYPPFLSEFLNLNFNFHTEHHLYPSLPWYRIRQARTLIREKLGTDYNEEIGIAWHNVNRKRDVYDVVRDSPENAYLRQKFS